MCNPLFARSEAREALTPSAAALVQQQQRRSCLFNHQFFRDLQLFSLYVGVLLTSCGLGIDKTSNSFRVEIKFVVCVRANELRKCFFVAGLDKYLRL